MGFTRKEVALLDINDIFRINAHSQNTQSITLEWKKLVKLRDKENGINDKLVLPSTYFFGARFRYYPALSGQAKFYYPKKCFRKIINLNQNTRTSNS